MIIGLDFDNTIVKYDRVFHEVAREKGLIGNDVPVSKIAVRNNLREQGNEDAWTEMQGYVYGCRMDLAEIYEGALDLMRVARDKGIQCKIISHKTQFPYMGPQYDLHKAARDFIVKFLADEKGPLIAPGNISFHETKARKIAHIGDMKCDFFLDDLPEILLDPKFPKVTKGLLFDPDGHHQDQAALTQIGNWTAFGEYLKL